MFHDVDETLRTFLAPWLPARTELSFEAPGAELRAAGHGSAGKEGTSRKSARRVVTLFLHDVREDVSGRGAGIADIRDAEHKVVGRARPVRRYQMTYLVTTEAGTAQKAHELLGRVLSAFATCDVLPAACLQGSLVGAPGALEVRVAEDIGPVGQSDLWSAWGTVPQASFTLMVVAPLVPEAHYEVGPLVKTVALDTAPETGSEEREKQRSQSAWPAPQEKFTAVRVRARNKTKDMNERKSR
ncbi:Pvc16 family protein [Streptomyces sp. NPDC047028]|uniref:Pvc16 family protein n=1 Tax=Streptomyces sp. NPDC047028 TaxID=3155793 RepID=UPI0033F5BF9B